MRDGAGDLTLLFLAVASGPADGSRASTGVRATSALPTLWSARCGTRRRSRRGAKWDQAQHEAEDMGVWLDEEDGKGNENETDAEAGLLPSQRHSIKAVLVGDLYRHSGITTVAILKSSHWYY